MPLPITPNTLEALILCILRHGPNYGLGMAEVMEARLPTYRVRPGTLYPAIRSLERRGMVASPSQHRLPAAARAPRGTPRRYFQLTASGKREAEQFAQLFRHLGAQVSA